MKPTPEQERQEAEREQCLQDLKRTYGIDVGAMVEAAFELGRHVSKTEERLRQCSIAQVDYTKRERWLWLRIGRIAGEIAKLRIGLRYMARLLMEEHNFLSGDNLSRCIQSATISGDKALLKRLTKVRSRLGSAVRVHKKRKRRKRKENKTHD